MGETDEDLFYDAHLDLQERMQNPIMFHAKMMGNIMYLQQASWAIRCKRICTGRSQGSQQTCVDSNNWTLKKQNEVPDDIQIVPSVWSMQCKQSHNKCSQLTQRQIQPPQRKAILLNELFQVTCA